LLEQLGGGQPVQIFQDAMVGQNLHLIMRKDDAQKEGAFARATSRLVDAGYDVSLLTAAADGSPPAVGPPVYGQLAVGEAATAANLPTSAPPWVRSINLDPRLRVAAGLGAQIVQRNQDRYLEEAWRQVGDVMAGLPDDLPWREVMRTYPATVRPN